VETLLRVDAQVCRRAREALPGSALHRAQPPEPGDWHTLARLYEETPCHVQRAPGALLRAARAPECELLVASAGADPAAYAALGRGDDFRGVVHEWAGSPAGVLACLERWLADHEELALLAGAQPHALVRALRAGGAGELVRPFAWLRLLDAQGLFASQVAGDPLLAGLRLEPAGTGGFCLAGAASRVKLRAQDALALLFGPRPPAAALAALSPPQRRALRARLPIPLFVWGFDSI
jgi:hypothetical protein